MKKFLMLLALIVSVPVLAHISTDNKDLLNRMNYTAAKTGLGTEVANRITTIKGSYSFATLGATTAYLTPAGYQVPASALIRNCFVRVNTSLGSVNSTTKVSLGLNTTTDILATTAIASIGGFVLGIPNNTASTMISMPSTASARILMSVTGSVLNAGNFDVYCDYVSIP